MILFNFTVVGPMVVLWLVLWFAWDSLYDARSTSGSTWREENQAVLNDEINVKPRKIPKAELFFNFLIFFFFFSTSFFSLQFLSWMSGFSKLGVGRNTPTGSMEKTHLRILNRECKSFSATICLPQNSIL